MPKRRAPPAPVYGEVWREVYLAGTEWDQFAEVDKVDWEFDHLDNWVNAMDDPGVEFRPKHRQVYLFGSTEPQLVDLEDGRPSQVVPIPVIVAVASKRPPPSTIGIKSVQRTEEEIIPMDNLKMGWFPVMPESGSRRGSFKPRIFSLKCEQRRVNIRNMKIDDVKKYDYVLPYIFFPGKHEDEVEDTVVNVMVELEGTKKPLVFEYDYEMDDLDEFVEEKIKEEELDAGKDSETLKTAIRQETKRTKKKYREEREARRRRLDDINPEERESLETMHIVKFYPDNVTPDVSHLRTKYINRYYGSAHELAEPYRVEEDTEDK